MTEFIIIKVFNILKILIARASRKRFIYISTTTLIKILSLYIRFIFIIFVFKPLFILLPRS